MSAQGCITDSTQTASRSDESRRVAPDEHHLQHGGRIVEGRVVLSAPQYVVMHNLPAEREAAHAEHVTKTCGTQRSGAGIQQDHTPGAAPQLQAGPSTARAACAGRAPAAPPPHTPASVRDSQELRMLGM